MTAATSLKSILVRLREHYGPLPEPPRDPFTLILLESVAYLAKGDKRKSAMPNPTPT